MRLTVATIGDREKNISLFIDRLNREYPNLEMNEFPKVCMDFFRNVESDNSFGWLLFSVILEGVKAPLYLRNLLFKCLYEEIPLRLSQEHEYFQVCNQRRDVKEGSNCNVPTVMGGGELTDYLENISWDWMCRGYFSSGYKFNHWTGKRTILVAIPYVPSIGLDNIVE